MGFWVSFAISIALSVVAELVRPKQAVPNATASALDDFEMPTAEYGRIIPVFVGKVRISGPNTVWTGDLKSKALTKKVKTGMFSSTKQTYAYEYYLGAQLVLGWGRPDTKIHEFRFDNMLATPAAANQADGSVLYTFNQRELFGGNEEEGGVAGPVRFYPGNQTQTANAYLASKIGEPVSAYPGLAYLVLEQLYVGTTKYIKAINMIVSSYPNQLGMTGDKHIIGEDCNPVCFIYEVLTEPVWSIGKQPSEIDIEALRRAAETCYAEGLGMSMLYNGSSTAEDVINDILRHIDGFQYSDPETGLYVIGLARADYDLATLPVFGEDHVHVESPPRFSRPSWAETRNTLNITFTDRANEYTSTPFPLQDLANIIQRDGEVSAENIDFGGFCKKEPATAMGLRSLRAYSYPLASLQVSFNRSAWKLHLGSVFKFNWPRLGMNNVVMRVTRVDLSSIAENKIGIDAVEDIFSVSYNSYDPPPDSEWINPVQPPQAVFRQTLMEAPYFLSEQEEANVLSMASPGGNLTTGFSIATGPTAANLAITNSSDDFTASATLAAIYPIGTVTTDATGTTATGFANTTEINVAPTANDIQIGDALIVLKSATTEEVLSYTAVNLATGAITGLRRGLFDTVPQQHPVGTQVWFINSGFAPVNPQPYLNLPATVFAKLLPYTALGTLPIEDATVMSITVNGRSARPYPPGRIRVNGIYPPAIPAAGIAGNFNYTWAHRNRTAVRLVSQDDTSVTPEEGTTQTIRVRNATGTLLAEKAGINTSATAATIQVAGYVGVLTVEIVAVRNGLESWQPQRHSFNYNGAAVTTTQIVADEASYVLDGGGA